MRPPGSDWLYVKLYGPAAGEDALLTGPVRDLAGRCSTTGDADGWFFLRYADPEPHLRLRLHGEPDRLLAGALPGWPRGRPGSSPAAADGSPSRPTSASWSATAGRPRRPWPRRSSLPTARRWLSCSACCRRRTRTERRLELAVLSTDRLLAALGLDVSARLEWCSAFAPPPHVSGAIFRERKNSLRALLSADRAAHAVLEAAPCTSADGRRSGRWRSA